MIYKISLITITWVAIVAVMPDPATISTMIVAVFGAIGLGAGIAYATFLNRITPARIETMKAYDDAYRASLVGKLEQALAERDQSIRERAVERDQAHLEREEMQQEIHANAARIDKLVERNEELSDDLSALCVKILEKRGFGVVGMGDDEASGIHPAVKLAIPVVLVPPVPSPTVPPPP